MNRRYLILAVLLIILVTVGPVTAKWVWSIADPSNPANAGIISHAESQGYWNFQYDDAAPFTTAGLYCCWWERWYKWQRFSTLNGETSFGTEDDETGLGSSASVETESYCPSCCATCDDSDPAALKARSDAIMAKKPWLTEGKKNTTPAEDAVTPVSTTAPVVMTFSDAE